MVSIWAIRYVIALPLLYSDFCLFCFKDHVLALIILTTCGVFARC